MLLGQQQGKLSGTGFFNAVDQLVVAIEACRGSTRRKENVRALRRGLVRWTTNDAEYFAAFVAIGQRGGHVGQAVLGLFGGSQGRQL